MMTLEAIDIPSKFWGLMLDVQAVAEEVQELYFSYYLGDADQCEHRAHLLIQARREEIGSVELRDDIIHFTLRLNSVLDELELIGSDDWELLMPYDFGLVPSLLRKLASKYDKYPFGAGEKQIKASIKDLIKEAKADERKRTASN